LKSAAFKTRTCAEISWLIAQNHRYAPRQLPNPLLRHRIPLSLSELGLHGTQTGKDLWSGKTVELGEDQPLELASHDVLLVRVDAPK
jgi:Alpha galactosidase C-terminal beta sandwich domain